jgi:hypothetical protein
MRAPVFFCLAACVALAAASTAVTPSTKGLVRKE